MTFLSDSEIRDRISNTSAPEEERIRIDPPPQDIQIGPCSVDLTLAEEYACFRRFPKLLGFRLFDPKKAGAPESDSPVEARWYKKRFASREKGFVIRPNRTVIAATKETVRLPKNALGLLTGRSSYSRLGLEVHLTQDLRQPWHSGKVLLQIKNNAPFPIRLYPGMRIAQLLVAELSGPCSIGYDDRDDAKYKREDGIGAQWAGDPELERKPGVAVRRVYLRALLDSCLAFLGIYTAVMAVPHMLGHEMTALSTGETAALVFLLLIALLRLCLIGKE